MARICCVCRGLHIRCRKISLKSEGNPLLVAPSSSRRSVPASYTELVASIIQGHIRWKQRFLADVAPEQSLVTFPAKSVENIRGRETPCTTMTLPIPYPSRGYRFFRISQKLIAHSSVGMFWQVTVYSTVATRLNMILCVVFQLFALRRRVCAASITSVDERKDSSPALNFSARDAEV